jgi:hypothetical protein
MHVESNDLRYEHQWLKHALNNAYKLRRFAPPLIEVLFHEVLFGAPSSTEKGTDSAKG